MKVNFNDIYIKWHWQDNRSKTQCTLQWFVNIMSIKMQFRTWPLHHGERGERIWHHPHSRKETPPSFSFGRKTRLFSEIFPPVETVLAAVDVVAELGAKVVEGELVGLSIYHHLATSHPERHQWCAEFSKQARSFFGIESGNILDVQTSPVGHSPCGSPEEGILLTFVTRRL